jgi:Protein of unknown function (DUF3800)
VVCKSQHATFTIEDLYDLVFPPDMGVNGYLCMVYECFLDDSKDANQSKMFVSAGFFGTRDDWLSLRKAWSAVLRDKGIDYFKSSEYNHLTHQFAKYRTDAYPPPSGRGAAKEIKTALQQVVQRHPRIRGIGVAVLVEDYNKVRARPETNGVFGEDPYHRALESVMFETVKIIRKRPGHNMVAFVHDEESDFETLHRLYLGFKKVNPKTAKYMAGFAPLSDKEHPPLQMADMIANNTLEVGIDRIIKGETDKAKIAMRENVNMLGWWNERYMLSVLKRNLIVKGRPIPIDLDVEEYG